MTADETDFMALLVPKTAETPWDDRQRHVRSQKQNNYIGVYGYHVQVRALQGQVCAY